ncbi:MAG: hypothetical protein LBK82_13170 [Planctomycetaceae bacterium]|nr:hypothetical protein [Planctomycetaceae bacterium]
MSLHFAVVNLVPSRLSPTRPFSERSPTSINRSPTSINKSPTSFDLSYV